MSRIEKLRKSRESASSVFIQIVNLNKKYSQPLYCCFEGEDYKYYGIRIETLKQKTYEKIIPLKCGGKKEVLRLYNLVSKEDTIKDKSYLYFVDLDFDESISGKALPIYETPTYSIENFYTSKEAFDKILINELKVLETDPYYDYCHKIYDERQAEFHSGITLLNAWIKCQRIKEDENNKINLSSFKINDILKTFSLEKVEFEAYSTTTLEDAFPNAFEITEAKIESAINSFSNPLNEYRGKFELDFLYKLLTQLILSMNKKNPPFEAKTKVSLNYSRVNILSELCQYAITPECLTEYLKKSA